MILLIFYRDFLTALIIVWLN